MDSLQAEAEGLYADGEIEQAQELLRAVASRSRASGDSAALARGLTWLSQAAWRIGDYEATRVLGEEALALKLAASQPDDLFRSYNVLGLLAWNESRPLDAVELFGEAGAAAEANADTANLAKVWNNLGLVQLSLGQYSAARDGFEAARRAAASQGEARIEGRVLINLGNLDLEVGDLPSAIIHLNASRPLLEAAGDAVGEQVLLGHLGTVHTAIGEPGKATEYLETALQLAKQNGLRQEEAINLEQLAELHRIAGDDQQALSLFAEARLINEELGLVDELAIDLRSEAEILADLGDILLAIDKVRQALSTHVAVGYPLEQLRDLVTLAELSAAQGWADSAAIYLDAAEKLSSTLDARSARITHGLGRARVARVLGRPDNALESLAAIEADLDESGYGRLWEAEHLRAWAHAALGDLDAAATAGARAISAVERTRLRYSSGALQVSHLNAREAVYAEQTAVLLRLGRIGEAFRVSDRVRGRSFMDHLAVGRDAAGAGSAAGQLIAAEELLRQIDDLSDRVDEIEELPPEWQPTDAAGQLTRLQAELSTARSAYAAAALRATQEDPRGSAILGEGGSGVEAVGTALRSDEALIEYLVTPDDLIIFVLTRDTVSYFTSRIRREALASRVRVARGAAGSRENGESDPAPALARLYSDLVASVRGSGLLGGKSRLLIVPHAELTYLPFSALRNPDSGRYLVEDYIVTHLPSASVLPVLRERTAPSGFEAVGFAPFPGDLPGTAVELTAMERAIPSVTLRRGHAATERRMRSTLASGPAVHAATHGVLSSRNPMYSRIELASGDGSAEDDGRLEVHELLGLRIRSPLIFLSGCETGVGTAWSTRFARGEDYATLSRAFLYAGAEAVIATLWPVEDEGASRFAERFYLEIPRLDSGEALAQAQRAMIADERYAQPYYWAAYRLTGRSALRFSAQ